MHRRPNGAAGDLADTLGEFTPDVADVTSEIAHVDAAIAAPASVRRAAPNCLKVVGGHLGGGCRELLDIASRKTHERVHLSGDTNSRAHPFPRPNGCVEGGGEGPARDLSEAWTTRDCLALRITALPVSKRWELTRIIRLGGREA